jgi:cytoskeleton protein RodZ
MMDEVEAGPTIAAASPASAGSILLAARNAAGLSLAEVGARTRIPLRHLEAIETGTYTDLPSTTYAVGFAKAYARAVGADEVQVAGIVRQDVAKLGRRQPEYTPYEIADPSRVPSRGVAVVGVGVALAVLILIGLWYGTNLFRGGSQSAQPAPAFTPVAAAPSPTPTVAAPAAQQVTLTANDEVWLRVYDGANKTLFQGTMKAGDHFDVPANANNPMINVGRPDKLSVTLNGSAVPPLGSGDQAIKDVAIGGAALAARASGAPLPTATASSTGAQTGSTSTSSPTPSAAKKTAKRKKADKPKRSEKPKRHLTETQRANLQSAANPPPPAPLDTTP